MPFYYICKFIFPTPQNAEQLHHRDPLLPFYSYSHPPFRTPKPQPRATTNLFSISNFVISRMVYKSVVANLLDHRLATADINGII